MPKGIYQRVVETLAEAQCRFMSKVEKTKSCWIWLGSHVTKEEYGRFWLQGKTVNAHRASWILFKGMIPEDKQIDHLCRNRRCVNPDHLEVVEQKENILRGESLSAKRARQTHCVHGHELSGPNLYIRHGGGRRCRKCARLRMRKVRDTKGEIKCGDY
jgi:hypothetical protein